MCAMIPMFRVLARIALLATAASLLPWVRRTGSGVPATSARLPAVVGEGLVGLGHLVGVLAPLDAGAEAIARVEQLVHQALGHRLLATLPAVADEPAQGESRAAARLDLDRHLVRRTADPAALDLDGGLDVVERAFERDHRVGAGLLAATLERVVHDLLGERALAA